MAQFDPDHYGDVTLPQLKKHWLREFRQATVLSAKVLANAVRCARTIEKNDDQAKKAAPPATAPTSSWYSS